MRYRLLNPVERGSMVEPDFDTWHEHEGTHSIKWQFRVTDDGLRPWDQTGDHQGEDRVLPMWVADMDFSVAPAIHEAIMARARHGLYGYAYHSEAYLESIIGWMKRRQGWEADSDWIVPTPGVVPSIHLIVKRFTQPGDKVLIQRPVYHPFTFAAERNGRIPVSNSLFRGSQHYQMDFEDLEAKVSQPDVNLAILCSPHNPVGRVWNTSELEQFARLCLEHDVLVVADEIHADLTMPGQTFSPFGGLAPELVDNAIICTAASKSFNLAGLKTSNLLIKNPKIRAELRDELESTGLFGVNPFGLVATQAAYDQSSDWLDRACVYIADNFSYLERYLAEHLPAFNVLPLQGTYLAWIDCRSLGLSVQELGRCFMEDARIYLDEGHIFGVEGEGYMRMNLACPRSLLEQALGRLRAVLPDA